MQVTVKHHYCDEKNANLRLSYYDLALDLHSLHHYCDEKNANLRLGHNSFRFFSSTEEGSSMRSCKHAKCRHDNKMFPNRSDCSKNLNMSHSQTFPWFLFCSPITLPCK